LNKCKLIQNKKGDRLIYFTEENAEANKRNNNIYNIPEDRRKIRANVEATIKEFVINFTHTGKLKVRTKFKTSLMAIATSAGINFGRIYRYLAKNKINERELAQYYNIFVKILILLGIKKYKSRNLRKIFFI